MNFLRKLINKQVAEAKLKGTKKIYGEKTFELPVHFADLKIENEPKSKRIGKNKKGETVCFVTFRTVLREGLQEFEALNLLHELKSDNEDNQIFEMS